MKRSRLHKKFTLTYCHLQWYLKTPERSLDEAYKAALVIKAEDEHFNGNKIAPESTATETALWLIFNQNLKQLKLSA